MGINNAKKIVIDEANELANELKNGNSGDIQVQGKAIALLVKMISPLYSAEFVTVEDCKAKHESLSKEDVEITDLSVGPLHIKGRVNALIIMIIVLAAGVIFAIGKTENWW
jgi:hypothetical protein